MRTFSKFLPLFAATLFAFVGSASAQLQTYETQTGYNGSVTNFNASGPTATRGEVFTNVSSVASLTYNFFKGTGVGPALSTTFDTTFGEWNVNTNSFVSGTTGTFGQITIPPSNGGAWANTLAITGAGFVNYSYTFDFTTLAMMHGTFGYITDSTKAYALMLTNVSGATNMGLGLNDSDVFAYGFKSGTVPSAGEDWVFSQIVIAPAGNVVPVPESSTVASVVVGVMVFGLVGFRINQRRRSEVAPVLAA